MRSLNAHRSDHYALKTEAGEGRLVDLEDANPEDYEAPPSGSPDNSSVPFTDRFVDNGTETHLKVAADETEYDHVDASNASGKTIQLARTNESNSDLAGTNLTLFHYDALVTNPTYNLTTINELQWPENFCVNVKLVVPLIDRAIESRLTPERCILLLGGDDSDGLFNIYIDELNQVGMGIMGQGDPEETSTDGIGPLETRFENNSIQPGHLSNLSFCYDTVHGDASIWEDQQLYISGKKIWNFPRKGKVSVFVGSHTVSEDGTVKQALFPEDEAKLYQIRITDNSATTTSTPSPLWAATHKEDWQEVNVNASEDTKGSKFVMARTTTTTLTTTTSTTTTTTTTILPHLHQFADNATIEIVNRTVETVTDKTVVTETVDADSKSAKQVVTVADAIKEGMPVSTNGSHHVTWAVVKTVK
jgi:hypothetical protein